MPTPFWLKNSLLLMQDTSKAYDLYHRLYDGSIAERFSDERVRQFIVSHDGSGHYNLNFSRVAVDAPMERTKLTGIVCPDEKARVVLNDFWTDNEMDFESIAAHEKAYEYGNSIVVCMPDELGQLQAYVHSPKDFAVFYDPARPRVKAYAVQTYTQFSNGDDESYSEFSEYQPPEYFVVVVYTSTVIQEWISVSPVPVGMARVDLQSLELRLREEVPVPVPGVMPVFHFRTARTPTGRSRLIDAAGPQEAIDSTVTAWMAAVKAAGYRQRYLTYKKATGIADAFSDAVPGSEEIDQNTYEAGPDSIFTFGGENVNVGSFDVSESSNFYNSVDKLVGYLAKISDTPTHYFSSGAEVPSGESYRLGERPLTAVVEHCEAMFGATWSELFKYVLAYNGISTEIAEVSWAPISVEDKEWWEVQQMKIELGMPREVAFVESGVDQETISAWFNNVPNVDETNNKPIPNIEDN